MIFSDKLNTLVEDSINKYIPEGKDPYLHVDRREVMREMIYKILGTSGFPVTKVTIISLCKNWRVVLEARYSVLN